MRALVTGANGFVGSALLRAAAAAGIEATGITRRETDYTPRSIASLVEASRADFVFHGAGSASVAASMQDPAADFASSVDLFARVLEGVRLSSHRPRVIFPSSAAVYGNAPRQPIGEDTPPAPISAYGFHKEMCERLAAEYAACFSVPALAVRIFSLFGSGQRRLLVWELFRQYRESAEVALAGTGEEERDYLHVDDCAALVWRCAGSVQQEFAVLNMASGISVRVADLARRMGSVLSSAKTVSCRGRRSVGDPVLWRAEVTRLRTLVPGFAAPDLDARLREVLAAWSQ
ncbi:MAG TPA: SDR family oxidoreductase [Burkholderiales bacterium]|nr:SDR family oxidoreductase [Burkholderiales bacterium]